MAILVAFVMFAVSCGGSDDGSDSVATSDTSSSSTSSAADEPEPEPTEAQEITIGGDEREAEEEPEAMEEEEPEAMEEEAEEEEAMEEEEEPAPAVGPAPTGTLRFVEFSPVTSFNPAASQTAQSAYHYPHYDTLTRQDANLQVQPNLATGWTKAGPNTWEMTLRDDVVFHDGTPFNAEAAVANMDYHASFEGNPNAGDWAAYVGASVVDDYTFQVEFTNPAPQFPLAMSMVMGMMINPNNMGDDLTRAPAGSGPWIWSDDESEAGVTEVYNLNPDYWNPDAQGVETVTVTAVPDNNARMNALLSGEADIMATTRDAQIQTGLDAGNQLVSVPNYFPYILVGDRNGTMNPAMGDPRVRQAMALSVDRSAYSDAIHAGLADTLGGYYPPAFTDFYLEDFDQFNAYDPDRARELLAEAGYADGVDVRMPIMPAINPHVELLVQMLGATGFNVELTQINNGELGPRGRSGEWEALWFRDLLVHPGKDLGKFTDPQGGFNPFKLDDLADLHAVLQEALGEEDTELARKKYGEVVQGLLERGAIIPLGHGGQNGMYAPNVEGVVLGLNMQAPMPYGVTVGE